MKKITICACAHRNIIDPANVRRLASSLAAAGWEVEVAADLCALAANDRRAVGGVVAACYPRAIKAMLSEVTESYDLRNNSPEEILAQMGIALNDNCAVEIPAAEGTEAWFPVIDKGRCTECRKCFDFCLFGVYSIVDEAVAVTSPANCKNGCPACARVCPSSAVIFPKYESSPINGGEPPVAIPTIDMGAVYGDALRERLAHRRASALKLTDDN